MANENQAAAKQNDTKRLYDTALDMFKHSRIGVGSADQKAMHCFRDAAAFLKVALRADKLIFLPRAEIII